MNFLAPDIVDRRPTPYDKRFALILLQPTLVELDDVALAALTTWHRHAIVASALWPTKARDALLGIAAELLPPIHTVDMRGPTSVQFWRDRVTTVWQLELQAGALLGTSPELAESLFQIIAPAHTRRSSSEAP